MGSYETYQVVCKACGGQRKIKIYQTPVGERIDWLEDKQEEPFTIISGRKRLDGEWGWQCICGNNDINTAQEIRMMANPASPTPQEVSQIVDSLKVQKPKFDMRRL